MKSEKWIKWKYQQIEIIEKEKNRNAGNEEYNNYTEKIH